MNAQATQMQIKAPSTGRVAAAVRVVNPIGDHSRLRRLAKVLALVVAFAAVLAILDWFGVDVGGWLAGLWRSLARVSPPFLLVALLFQTSQTALNALAWRFILRAAYPHADIRYAPILTAYAVGVALNAILPADIGTFVMLFMYVAIVPGGTVAGVFGSWLVQRIFFTVMSAFVYLYLFVAVPGSFSVELGGLRQHPALVAVIVGGGLALLAVLGRVFVKKLRELWAEAKQGGAILRQPRRYAVQVVLPSLGAYLTKLAVIGTMLAAFSIPVTFGSIMHVVAGNSIANSTSPTPGGAGVTQAISVVALHDYTNAQTATAYSVSQQLVTTAWNVSVALVLVLTVFGWTDGRALVKRSYAEAKERTRRRRGDASPAEAAS
jgi:uncharacterized membrane protein YbhN (UPF0104 family)